MGAPPYAAIENNAKKGVKTMKMKTALTIAGSDCSGGAGIQADLKTMTMNGVYAMSAITALTAQNTTGVRAIQESTPDFLKQQIDAVFDGSEKRQTEIRELSDCYLVDFVHVEDFWKFASVV